VTIHLATTLPAENGEAQKSNVTNANIVRAVIESMIFADRAETALRAYFLTHQHQASVSEFAEYSSMKKDHQRAVDQRYGAYTSLVNHQKTHGRAAA
jgi:hypothetical protein